MRANFLVVTTAGDRLRETVDSVREGGYEEWE